MDGFHELTGGAHHEHIPQLGLDLSQPFVKKAGYQPGFLLKILKRGMRMTDITGFVQDPVSYGVQWAKDYDDLEAVSPEQTEAAIDTITQLAAGGPVLEAAAATGRIAIPLAKRGLQVTATDASPDMIERLVVKDTARQVRTRVEALPEIKGDETYSVISILVNSVWVMQRAEDQLAFLSNAKEHLRPGGVVVVEMGVVDTSRWARPMVRERGGSMMSRTTRWNPKTQQVHHQFSFEGANDISPRDVYLRYIMPDELLAMAAKAGVRPQFLWSDWHRTPFDRESKCIIAVLEDSSK